MLLIIVFAVLHDELAVCSVHLHNLVEASSFFDHMLSYCDAHGFCMDVATCCQPASHRCLRHLLSHGELAVFSVCLHNLVVASRVSLTTSVMRVDRLTSRSMILTLREVLTKRHCVLKARLE